MTDLTVGVDRSSASRISKLDAPTTFLTLDTYGFDDIGPSIAGAGFVRPDRALEGDQLDLIGVLAGPSSNGGLALLAGGLGYRFLLDNAQTYGFVQAAYGEFDLGTSINEALDIDGEQLNISLGVKKYQAPAERRQADHRGGNRQPRRHGQSSWCTGD